MKYLRDAKSYFTNRNVSTSSILHSPGKFAITGISGKSGIEPFPENK